MLSLLTKRSAAPPMPPVELRQIVGPTEDKWFENVSGDPAMYDLPSNGYDLDHVYRRVFDFGCGCGRQARQLMLQRNPPDEYVGIDISKRLIEWCQNNLTPYNKRFTFQHHDVRSITYAPDNSSVRMRPLDFPDGYFTLANAHSVFTHLHEDQAMHYLKEITRIVDDNALIRTTWFAMNRRLFGALADCQHSVFLNEIDTTQAVYFDWSWIQRLMSDCGLRIASVKWPALGSQFAVILTKRIDRGQDPLQVWPEHGTIPGF